MRGPCLLATRTGVHDGADKLHGDPFTTIGRRLEKNAVRAAIERLPDGQQRQVLRLMYVDGLAQLSERRSREVLLALYRDRLDYPSARFKLDVGATELEELHQAALDDLIQHGRS